MKKVISLLLIVAMICSMCITSFAIVIGGGDTNTTDYTNGTQVSYTGTGVESYVVTVPAELTPGQSGTVTLSGAWASNKTVKVTADTTVTLTNGLDENDQKTLNITFAGIEKAGNNIEAKTYTETVSVAEMPADVLFGTWSGKFNYYVEMTDGTSDNTENVKLLTFNLKNSATNETKSYYAEEGMTWREWIESDYNDGSFTIPTESNPAEYIYYNGNQLGYPADSIIVGGDIEWYLDETTAFETEILTLVNSETSTNIAYECVDSDDANDTETYRFIYQGDGVFVGWEFVDLVEGVDYELLDEDDAEITIIYYRDGTTKQTITINAIVEM